MVQVGAKTKQFVICSKCNKEKLHYAKGLCRSCYNVQRYNIPPVQ